MKVYVYSMYLSVTGVFICVGHVCVSAWLTYLHVCVVVFNGVWVCGSLVWEM